MARFDLHLHSNNSDGSDTVSELWQKIKDKEIEFFALTDHDTVAGISVMRSLVTADVKFIPAIELTSKARNIKCHILGYNIDETNSELLELIAKGKLLRKQKLDTRIKYLKEVWGIELTEDELNWLNERKSVVKTHLANILVKRGLASDNVKAMKKYLDGCKTGNTRFDGEEAISTIKQAGGVPVWAHPLGGEGEVHLAKDEFLSKLAIMTDCGIQGLECYYSRYTEQEIEFLKECANKNGLMITGGSDYHGTNKTVLLGQLNVNNSPVDSKELKLNFY